MTEFGQAMILSRSLYWSPASLTVLRIATATAVSSNIFNAATTVYWSVDHVRKQESQVPWHVPIISVTEEAEAGGLQV